MVHPPTHRPDDIELIPDAWGRFERAVDTVSKAGPQHRVSVKRPNSFLSALDELKLLIDEPGVPQKVIDVAVSLFQDVSKCLFVSPQVSEAPIAGEPEVILQPSNLLLHFMAAIRAHDWDLVSVIEHDAAL